MAERWYLDRRIQAGIISALILGAAAIGAAYIQRPLPPKTIPAIQPVPATRGNPDPGSDSSHATVSPPERLDRPVDDEPGPKKTEGNEEVADRSPPRPLVGENPTKVPRESQPPLSPASPTWPQLVEVTSRKPVILPGTRASLSVSFETLQGVEYATLVIVPSNAEPIRQPLMAAGKSLRFESGGHGFALTIVDLHWDKETATVSVDGNLGDEP